MFGSKRLGCCCWNTNIGEQLLTHKQRSKINQCYALHVYGLHKKIIIFFGGVSNYFFLAPFNA